MRKLIPPIYQVMVDLIPLVDADTNAFNMYMVGACEVFLKRQQPCSSDQLNICTVHLGPIARKLDSAIVSTG